MPIIYVGNVKRGCESTTVHRWHEKREAGLDMLRLLNGWGVSSDFTLYRWTATNRKFDLTLGDLFSFIVQEHFILSIESSNEDPLGFLELSTVKNG